MVRFMVLGAALMVLTGASAARGQDADVKALKKEIELLQAKLETANLKIEKLERENQLLKKGGGKDLAAGDKPKHTDGTMNGGTEAVEYVLDKVTRNGRQVTLDITATLTKGPDRRQLIFFGVNAVDAGGNAHKVRVNAGGGGKAIPERVDLRAGIAIKMQIRFPLPPDVTQLQTLEVTMSAVERVAIVFSNLEIPK